MHPRAFGRLLAAAFLAVEPCSADVPRVSAPGPPHRAALMLGWDQTWVSALAYGHRLQVSGGPELELQPSITVPVLNALELDAIKVEADGNVAFIARSGVGVALSVGTGLAVTHDPTGTKAGWLATSSVRPGYYAAGGAVALDLEWRASLATYMSHSARVRDLFRDRYPEGREPASADLEPHDGWYGIPASRLRVGLAGGYVFGGRAAALALGGFEYSPQVEGVIANPSIGGMPFFALLGGDYRW